MDHLVNRCVVVAGSTGLTGSLLTDMLEQHLSISEIRLLVRKSAGRSHPKIREIITDFSNDDLLKNAFAGADTFFCCLGTTLKKAGSKEAFFEVDFTLVTRLAALASASHVQRFICISSMNAHPGSSNFYLRTKGEMEQAVKSLPFKKIAFVRPSLLTGHRSESRPLEIILQFFLSLLSLLPAGPLKKYRPIKAETVARAMVIISFGASNRTVYESDELQWLGH
jgi:uncharacterized protein YbjT (DUF2867 family)